MFLEPCLGNCSWTRCLTLVYRNLAWEAVLGSLAWEPVLGSLFLGTCSWEHCLVTCSWELSLGTLFLETLPACFKPVHWDLAREPVFSHLFPNFAWEPCLGTCPSEPCLGFCFCFQPCLRCSSICFFASCSWEAVPGNMSNLFLGTLLGNLFVEPFLQHCFGTFLDNLACQPIIRNLAGETVIESLAKEPCFCLGTGTLPGNPLLANLFLETFFATYFLETCSWEPCLGTCSWEPCSATVSGTLPWEPCLGTCFWEPGLGIVPGNLACELVPGKFARKSCSWDG